MKRIFYLTFSFLITAWVFWGLISIPEIATRDNGMTVLQMLGMLCYFIAMFVIISPKNQYQSFLHYFMTFRHKKAHFKNLDNIYIKFNRDYNAFYLYEQSWFYSKRLESFDFTDVESAMQLAEEKLNEIFATRLAQERSLNKRKNAAKNWDKSITRDRNFKWE